MKHSDRILLAFFAIILAGLACSLGGAEEEVDPPVAVIVLPENGEAFAVGQVVNVVATITSEAGVEEVKLLVNGETVATEEVPDAPKSHSLSFEWVPSVPGAVVLAVIGYDVEGNDSEAAMVTIQVAEAVSEGSGGEEGQPTQAEAEQTIMCTPPPCGANEAYYCPGTCPGGCGITCATFTPTSPPPSTATFTPHPPTLTFTPTNTSEFVIPSIQIIVSLQVLQLATVETVYEQVSIAPGTIGYTTATCPSETVVVSGGYASSPDMLVYTQSMNGNGWRAYARNNAGSDKLLNVYARCLKNTAGSTQQVFTSGQVQPGDILNVEQACPAGTIVTGGGFASKSDGSLNVYNTSKSGNGWQIWARNTSGSAEQVNVYAICLSGVNATTYDTLNSVSVPAGGSQGDFVACSDGDLAVGGGFAAQNDLRMYNSSPRPTTTNEWVGYGRNSSSDSRTFFNYAICLTFD